MAVADFGITAEPPSGVDCVIFRNTPTVEGETTYPILQASTIDLSNYGLSDFGTDVVDGLGPLDYLCVMAEYEPSNPLGDSLDRVPQLASSDFAANVQIKAIEGQYGYQGFLQVSGRVFTLFVIVGSTDFIDSQLDGLNAFLASIVVGSGDYSLVADADVA